jgi:channel protein (hemolysin III family)
MHLCTIPFAVIAALVLVRAAPSTGARLGAAVYGATLCALFTVSALYHRVRWYAVAHLKIRCLDQGTIFLADQIRFPARSAITRSGTRSCCSHARANTLPSSRWSAAARPIASRRHIVGRSASARMTLWLARRRAW